MMDVLMGEWYRLAYPGRFRVIHDNFANEPGEPEQALGKFLAEKEKPRSAGLCRLNPDIRDRAASLAEILVSLCVLGASCATSMGRRLMGRSMDR